MTTSMKSYQEPPKWLQEWHDLNKKDLPHSNLFVHSKRLLISAPLQT